MNLTCSPVLADKPLGTAKSRDPADKLGKSIIPPLVGEHCRVVTLPAGVETTAPAYHVWKHNPYLPLPCSDQLPAGEGWQMYYCHKTRKKQSPASGAGGKANCSALRTCDPPHQELQKSLLIRLDANLRVRLPVHRPRHPFFVHFQP